MRNKNGNSARLSHIIKQELLNIPVLLTRYFFTLTLDPQLYLPASLATTLLAILLRLKGWRGKLPPERFLEEVEDDLIHLNIKVNQHKGEAQTLVKALEVAPENSKFRIENELDAEMERIRVLEERIVYLETLYSSLKTIEILRHKYGEQVDKVYEKIILVSKRIEEGRIKDTSLENVFEDLIKLREKTPEFPYIIRETIKDKLSKGE